MAFSFSYQSILDYRSHQAELAEMELARLQRSLLLAEGELRRLVQRWHRGRRQLAQGLQKGLAGKLMQVWRLYVTDLEAQLERQTAAVEELRDRVAEARSKLLEAVKNRKAMELLQQRQKEIWLREETRQELRELGEIGVRTAARRLS
ncbi:MAG: flagellar export protein FliJ [Deltaproteobacteria bacterium]|nr:flagellar export protein FliJ [Deltaproteobacteria bacterium]MBW2069730.1 flagellar export protein FliJ [Deltaproteobacteria bacterium]